MPSSSPLPIAAPPGPRPVLQVALGDDAASAGFGERLAAMVLTGICDDGGMADGGFTIHFSGDLGAGKTTVVRALLRRLGVTGRIKSPTFTLVETYTVEMPKSVESRQDVNLYCYHFDFYRFEDPQEWMDAGFRDPFSDAALRLVEWPERACSDGPSLLPPPDLAIAIAYDEPGRLAVLDAHTPRGQRWLTPAAASDRSPLAADDC